MKDGSLWEEKFQTQSSLKVQYRCTPKIFIPLEVPVPKLHKELRYVKFWIVCYFVVFIKRGL